MYMQQAALDEVKLKGYVSDFIPTLITKGSCI